MVKNSRLKFYIHEDIERITRCVAEILSIYDDK